MLITFLCTRIYVIEIASLCLHAFHIPAQRQTFFSQRTNYEATGSRFTLSVWAASSASFNLGISHKYDPHPPAGYFALHACGLPCLPGDVHLIMDASSKPCSFRHAITFLDFGRAPMNGINSQLNNGAKSSSRQSVTPHGGSFY
jgi:hypothetical protein